MGILFFFFIFLQPERHKHHNALMQYIYTIENVWEMISFGWKLENGLDNSMKNFPEEYCATLNGFFIAGTSILNWQGWSPEECLKGNEQITACRNNQVVSLIILHSFLSRRLEFLLEGRVWFSLQIFMSPSTDWSVFQILILSSLEVSDFTTFWKIYD